MGNEQTEKKGWFLIGIFIWTAVVYSPVLTANYVGWDDMAYLLHNPIFKWPWKNFLQTIFTPGSIPHEELFIPIAYLGFFLDYLLRWPPWFSHLVNLLLHLLNGFLFIRILTHLHFNYTIRIWMLTVFLLHPFQTESVAWVFSRRDLLAACLFLLSCHLFLPFYQSVRSSQILHPFLQFFGAAILFILSLLTKPMYIFLPLLWIWFPIRISGSYQHRWYGYGCQYGLILISMMILILNFKISPLGNLSTASIIGQIPWYFLRFCQGCYAGLQILQEIIFFFPPKIFYLNTDLSPEMILLAPILLWLFLGTYLVIWSYKNPPIRVCLFLSVFLSLPLTLIFLSSQRIFYFGARYIYLFLPLLGIFVAHGINRLSTQADKIHIVLIFITITIGGWRTFQITQKWKDNLSFGEYALHQNPNNPIACNILAIGHYQKGEVEKAIQILKNTMSRHPSYLNGWQNLAFFYSALHPNHPSILVSTQRLYLAKYGYEYSLFLQLQRLPYRDASNFWLFLARLQTIGYWPPTQWRCYRLAFALANYAQRIGEWSYADRFYALCLQLHPTFAPGWYNWGILAENQGKLPLAKERFLKAQQYEKTNLFP